VKVVIEVEGGIEVDDGVVDEVEDVELVLDGVELDEVEVEVGVTTGITELVEDEDEVVGVMVLVSEVELGGNVAVSVELEDEGAAEETVEVPGSAANVDDSDELRTDELAAALEISVDELKAALRLVDDAAALPAAAWKSQYRRHAKSVGKVRQRNSLDELEATSDMMKAPLNRTRLTENWSLGR
jgi:hypothetical protein